MIKMDTKKICIREVNENLRRVRAGQELTRPLKQLNDNCDFKNKYKEAFDIWEEDAIRKEYNEMRRKYQKEYNKRPEVKAKLREYQQRPEVKEKKKEYSQKPEVKAKAGEYQKEYQNRPEVKERTRKRQREYDKKYYQIPEVKARKKEYSREHYQKNKKSKTESKE